MTPLKLKWIISLMVFSFSFLLPAINIYILFRLNRISSITLKNKNERTFPYILTACFYFGLFYLFLDLNIWPSIKILIFGAGFAILLTALINLKYKISAHMVGIGGLAGSLCVISYNLKYNAIILIAAALILSGIIASSRLYLNEHQSKQLYFGFFLGWLVQVLIFLFFLKFNFL